MSWNLAENAQVIHRHFPDLQRLKGGIGKDLEEGTCPIVTNSVGLFS